MKLISIFVSGSGIEGLHAVRYDGNIMDIYSQLMNDWNDTKYIRDYLKNNFKDFDSGYYDISISEGIDKVISEANNLETLLYQFVKSGFEKSGKRLQMLFKPLINTESYGKQLQKSKAEYEPRQNYKSILRLYAIKIGENTFVITGGAIKLNQFMEEHPDTKKELKIIDQVRDWLKENGIYVEDDLIYYYEETR